MLGPDNPPSPLVEPHWWQIQPQSVKKPDGIAPQKYENAYAQAIYEKVVFHRPAWFSFLVPIVLVYVTWLYVTVSNDLWPLFQKGWTMTVTMVLGAFVAGSTTLGGGAVAFPVMTLVLQLDSSIARDFSLMIQSIGMTAALWGIFYQRIVVDMTAFVYCGLGGAIGVVLGFLFVAHRVPSNFTAMFFVSFWLSFAIALYMVNRNALRKTVSTIGNPDRTSVKVGLVCVGVLGGVVTSMTGSGLDIVSFSALTLLFRMSENSATPTCVSLMGVNTVVGTVVKAFLFGMDPQAVDLVWFAFPVVVVMAPVGAFVASFLHRKMLALWVYVLCTIQFISAYIVLTLDWGLVVFSISSVLVGSILWYSLVYASDSVVHEETNFENTSRKSLKGSSSVPNLQDLTLQVNDDRRVRLPSDATKVTSGLVVDAVRVHVSNETTDNSLLRGGHSQPVELAVQERSFVKVPRKVSF